MGRPAVDESGNVYGRLTVLKRGGIGSGNIMLGHARDDLEILSRATLYLKGGEGDG